VSALHAWRVTATLAFRAWPAGAVGRVLLSLVVDISRGLVPGLALRAVLDGRGAGWMALLVASALVQLATGTVWEWLQRGLTLRTTQAATQAVMAAALAPAGIDHLESPRYADAMEVVRANARGPALLFDWLASAVGGLIGIGASAFVLAGVHPLLLLPVAGAAGLGVAHAATRKRALVYMDDSLPGQRLTRRLS
jgi:ATP-binding cassette subfamily B protein